MQRVAIITPFSNMTVEEEFQRYINNPELVYQIFKLDYLTHKSDNEKKFYDELTNSLKGLTKKLSFTVFNKIINMCSSLNIHIDDNTFDSNLLLKEFIGNQQFKPEMFISPYSEKVTRDITGFLEINPTVKYIHLKHSLDYYKFGKDFLEYIAQQYSGTVLVSCTNIPTLDLIYKCKYKIISTNQAVINHLNKLR